MKKYQIVIKIDDDTCLSYLYLEVDEKTTQQDLEFLVTDMVQQDIRLANKFTTNDIAKKVINPIVVNEYDQTTHKAVIDGNNFKINI